MQINTATADYGRTFPLYVPPIDWFFLVDDSPKYTMSFFLDLDFSGQLDQEIFQQALNESLARHPLLFCVIEKAKRDRLCWVPRPEKISAVDWAGDDVPLSLQDNGYLDIQKTTGLRIWVRQSSQGARVTMQFHHSACDGTGAYRFVGDLLGCYMKRLPSCQGKVQLGNYDAALLKVRRSKMRSIRIHDSSFKKFRIAAAEGWNHIRSRTAPLKVPSNSPQGVNLPGMVKQSFAADELAKLRSAATSRGGTLNDLFLAKLFQAILQWNGSSTGSRRIRILVPADMRDGQDFEIPACNMTACTFITRSKNEIQDEQRLLDLCIQDTLALKGGGPQSAFVNAITSAMEGSLLPKILKFSGCMATSVFSNAGDPSRRFTGKLPKKRGKISCEEFTLEAITGVPPLRVHTHSTLSSSIYGRNLTFSLRCDPFLFGTDDTRAFLDVFSNQLRELVTD